MTRITYHVSRITFLWFVTVLSLYPACTLSPRTVAFAWDGETFRQREASGVTVPAPEPVQQADLDGDGALETVELQWGKLRLIDDGQTAWRSDPAWTVTRFALTDVDNDDALDIFFTVWKPDEAGVPRCHPFIYGWRRDAWRPVWFGSAVADPIADFVVGDVDGDGRNELVVLEGLYGQDLDAPGYLPSPSNIAPPQSPPLRQGGGCGPGLPPPSQRGRAGVGAPSRGIFVLRGAPRAWATAP